VTGRRRARGAREAPGGVGGLLAWPYRAWRERRARRARGRAGERKVAAVLEELAAEHRLRVRHRVRLRTRDGRRGDLDHAVLVGRPVRLIVAIETKAQRPHPAHFHQVRANAQRASRRHFDDVPQYRIVVHPNSNEPIAYDPDTRAARMGLARLPGYLRNLLAGEHSDRLAR
jgi:hypothetical protein